MNKQLRLLLYSSNIWYLGEGMLGPLFAIFTEQVGGNVLDISWAWAVYLAVTGILLIFFGKIADHNSKEKLLVLGYFLNALFTFSYILVTKPIHLLFVQTGLGLAASLAVPTWNALYAKYEDHKKEAAEWGLATGEGQIVTAIAIIIGGLIVTEFGFKFLFITMGCVQIAAAIYASRLLFKNAKTEKTRSKR